MEEFLRKCIRRLGVSPDKPFQNASNYLKDNQDKFGVDVKNKFALAMYSQEELAKLDNIIGG
ncbi:unnamed protein product [marine sediment metagenome]|uniref:Uncharacterized protein n=1 Tax=marine sediment metagenome TaxID=412755 RepID=X1C8X4_9ZZZZ